MQNYSQERTSSSSPNEDYMGFIFIVFFVLIGGFGRRVTVPSVKGKGRKMRKHGRRMYAGVGFALSLLVTRALASFIISAFISYTFLLFGVLMALAGRTGA